MPLSDRVDRPDRRNTGATADHKDAAPLPTSSTNASPVDLASLARSFDEVAVVGMIVINTEGAIATANPAACQLFGYEPHELAGKNVNTLMPSPYRDEHDNYLRAYLQSGHRKIIGIGREVEGLRKDGSIFPLDLAVSEVTLGEGQFFVGTVHDISTRKRAEQELRGERDFAESLLETAQTIVLLLDAQGRIVRFNRHMAEVSGFELSEVLLADWFDTFLPPEDRERVRRVFEATLAGHAVRGQGSPILTKSGELREIEWHAVVQQDAAGKASGVLAVGQDITGRRSLEEQLRLSQKLEAVGRFAAGLAHDFNTLLGSILGYSEMLLHHQETTSAQTHQIQQIHRVAERGALLTRQLLSFSRPSISSLRTLDFNEVIGNVEEMVRRLIGHGIELEDQLAETWPVRAGGPELEQVVMNLLVNARDAVGAAGRITIATRNVAANQAPLGLSTNDWVLMAITDNGCGMDEHTLAHAFEPFFTTKPSGKGTGLGLAVVHGIVRELGGEVRVHSAPAQGSRFEIFLPRAPGALFPNEIDGGATLSEAAGTSKRPRRSAETVLLVEDDQLFREMLTEFLQDTGRTVLDAADPTSALRTAASYAGPIDLLITDFMLPEMDGFALARAFAEGRPSAKILILSGSSAEELAERAHAENFSFLSKPFNTSAFLEQIESLLRKDSPS